MKEHQFNFVLLRRLVGNCLLPSSGVLIASEAARSVKPPPSDSGAEGGSNEKLVDKKPAPAEKKNICLATESRCVSVRDTDYP